MDSTGNQQKENNKDQKEQSNTPDYDEEDKEKPGPESIISDTTIEEEPLADYDLHSELAEEETEEEIVRSRRERLERNLESLPQNASQAELYRAQSDEGLRKLRKDPEFGRIQLTSHGTAYPEDGVYSGEHEEEVEDLMLKKDFSVDTSNEEEKNENNDQSKNSTTPKDSD